MLIVLVDVVLVEGLTDLTLGCNRGRSTPPLDRVVDCTQWGA